MTESFDQRFSLLRKVSSLSDLTNQYEAAS